MENHNCFIIIIVISILIISIIIEND